MIIQLFFVFFKMQLYALDNTTPILATEALKQKNYQCPECLNCVRLRGGPHRQFHFYHVRSHTLCHQHQKSLAHLQLQLHLKSLIPNSSLEKRFSQIGRIADVAWEEKRLVFEIQCSSISLNEAQNRSQDYARIGYTVVWILHDRRFNKKNLSAAENFLRTKPCYFAREKSLVYDQFDIVQGSKRIFRGPLLPIDPTQPIPFPSFENPPPRLWPLAFKGDFLDRFSKDPQNNQIKFLKKKFSKHRFSLKKFYLFVFETLLKKFCK